MRVAYFDESDHTVNRLPRIVSTNGGLASRRPAMRQGRYWAVGMAEGDGGWGDEKSALNVQIRRGGGMCFCCQWRFLSPRRQSPNNPLPRVAVWGRVRVGGPSQAVETQQERGTEYACVLSAPAERFAQL